MCYLGFVEVVICFVVFVGGDLFECVFGYFGVVVVGDECVYVVDGVCFVFVIGLY